MKKILALTLAILMTLALCACGSNSSGKTDTSADSTMSDIDSDKNTNSSTDDSEEAGYVGTWVHERTDAEPFSMNITLNADGTGKSGKTTDVEWAFDATTKQISLILIFPDGSKEEATHAILTEENKLCWERSFTIKTETDEFIKLDKVIFERSN